MSNYKAKKVATYRDRYFTVITYSYRGKEYDVTYPNDWSVLTSVARVQHEDAQAEIDFSYLTKADIKEREAFYVLESINPDEEAENHYDGEVVKRWI